MTPLDLNRSILARAFWLALAVGALFLGVFALNCGAQSVRLVWNPSTSDGITNYNVYCSTNGWPTTNAVVIQTGTNCSVTLLDIKPAQYAFAATCQNANGAESPFSNVVNWGVPEAPGKLYTFVLQFGAAPNIITNPVGMFRVQIVTP